MPRVKQTARKSAAFMRPSAEPSASDLITCVDEFRRFTRAKSVLIKKAKAKKEKPAKVKFQSVAVKALQEASEAFLVGIFQDANLLAIHCGRATVTPSDVKLIRILRGEGL